MHLAGIVFAIAGTVLLILWATGNSAATITGVSVYGAALIASFVASACYHFTPWEGPRPVLRRIDHAAIYLKIAGTYTPLVVLIGSAFAYGVLIIVWALAVIGVAAKLFFWPKSGGGSGHMGTALYLGMGWLSVALLTSLIPVLPTTALGLIVAGGLIYSAGALVFSLDGLRFQNAIWHGFVLVASVCFFAAIAMGVIP
ncbi:UNVERIFIED_CONTAM: hypothetical protein GTU68_066643 [Idotea baltica]|nr:hypothetical protein [Idotea baltica]